MRSGQSRSQGRAEGTRTLASLRSAGLLGTPSSFKPLRPDSLTVPQTGVPLKPLLEELAPFLVCGPLPHLAGMHLLPNPDKWPAVQMEFVLQTPNARCRTRVWHASCFPTACRVGRDGASLRRFGICSAEVGFIIGDWPLLLTR